MSIIMRFKIYIQAPFVRHFLMVLNLCLFFAISFISLALDTRHPFNLVNIALVGLFVAITLAYLLLTRTKPKLSLFLLCGIGLLLWMLVSYAANGFGPFSATPILMTILSIAMYLWLSANRKYTTFYLLAFLLASWCFIAVFVVLNFSAIIHPDLSKRIGSTLGNENDVARHLVFAFLINGYHLYVFKKKLLRCALAIGTLLCLYLLLLTGSMSNLLLAIACSAVFALVIAKKKQRIWASVGIVTAIVLLIVLIFSLPALSSIKERLSSILSALFGWGTARSDNSTLSRFRAARYGFELLFESPLFGNGFNSVYSNFKIMAHNNIAEIGADFGLPALILEEVLILYPLLASRKKQTKDAVFIAIVGFYIFAVQFFLVTFNSKIEAIMIPLLYVLFDKDRSFIPSWQIRQGYLPTYRAKIK